MTSRGRPTRRTMVWLVAIRSSISRPTVRGSSPASWIMVSLASRSPVKPPPGGRTHYRGRKGTKPWLFALPSRLRSAALVLRIHSSDWEKLSETALDIHAESRSRTILIIHGHSRDKGEERSRNDQQLLSPLGSVHKRFLRQNLALHYR